MKLSILMITYNHEQFIAQAIDSVLMQKVDIDYEIVIGDDYSTDNTRQIILDYKAKYPNKIKLILHENNIGGNRNFVETYKACSGDFIAILEGDDYWIYNQKIQSQIKYLEEHPECSFCFHNVLTVYADQNKNHKYHLEKVKPILELKDILPKNIVPTCSTMFRNLKLENFPNWFFELKMGDWPFFIFHAEKGNIGYIDEMWAAYRLHENGVWASMNEMNRLKAKNELYENLKLYLDFKYEKILGNLINQNNLKLSRLQTEIDKIKIDSVNYTELKKQQTKFDSEKKKIIVVQGGFPALSATFILDQITGLIDRGFEIENWSTYNPNESIIHSDIEEYDLLSKTKYILMPHESLKNDVTRWVEEFQRLNNISGLENVHAFHVHYGPNFNLLEQLFRSTNKYIVVSFHGYDASRYIKTNGENCYDYLFQRANLITTPSNFMKNVLVNRGASEEKITVHRYGINLDKFKHEKRLFNKRKIRLLSVARLVEKKGLEDSIEAFSKLDSTFNAEYRIIGDGEFKSKLQRLIEDLGVEEKVKLVGARSKKEIISEMKVADIFVLTSVTASDGDQEGVPVSLIESHAIGLPVISTLHAGIPELVFDRKTGLLSNEHDVSKIAENMESLIKSAALRKEYSLNARERVEQEFNIEFLNDRLADYLNQKFSPIVEETNNVLLGKLKRIGWLSKLDLYDNYFDYAKTISSVANPSISVIVISWRMNPDIFKNFELLQKQREQNFELIFVDNGGQREEFKSVLPFVNTYIRLNINTGAYIARNIGSLFAKAPILLFLDDDCFPAKNLIEAHRKVFQQYDVVAVRGVVHPRTDSPLNNQAAHYYLGDKPFPIFADLEGNTSYDADVFFKVGGWDDEIEFGGGGVELSIRISKLVPDLRKQIYSPEPVIFHDYATDKSHLEKKRAKQKSSRQRLRQKYPNWDEYLSSWQKYSGKDEFLIAKDVHTEEEQKNDKILFSICIPTYNRADYIKDALTSALQQDYNNFEIVVVDDGSTDGTENIVHDINDNRIRYIFKPHTNAPDTRNKAVEEAKGDYILWLDSDDMLLPGTLSAYSDEINQNPDVDIFYGDLQITDSMLNPIRTANFENWYKRNNALLAKMVFENPVPNPAVLIRNKFYEEIGKYDESFVRAHDYEWFTRAVEKAEFLHIDKIVCKWRWHNTNMSSGSVLIDHSYDARILEQMIEKHDLQLLFPELKSNGLSKNQNRAKAFILIASRFMQLNCHEKAKSYFEKSYRLVPIPETKKIIDEHFKSTHTSEMKMQLSGDDNLNILLVVHNFPPDWFAGVENYTLQLAQTLLAKGYQVSVLYPKVDLNFQTPQIIEDRYQGIQVYKLIHKGLENIFQIRSGDLEKSFVNFLNGKKFDVVHFQHLQGLPLSLIEIAKKLDIPVCFTLHDFAAICFRTHLYIPENKEVCSGPSSAEKCYSCIAEASQPKSNSEIIDSIRERNEYVRNLLDQVDLIVSPSKFLADVFGNNNYAINKITVSPLGLIPVANRIKKSNRAKIKFGYLGSIHELKNVERLCRAYGRTTGDTQLLIWGNGNEQAIKKLKNLINENLNIKYFGPYEPDQLPDILNEIDILVVPSIIENYPTVIREALSVKIPVVASNAGGIPEIIVNNRNGVLFNPLDEKELEVKLQKFIDNPKLIKQLRGRIKPPKTIHEDVNEWIERYRKLLNKQVPIKTDLHKVSIIIPVFNKVEYTRKCIQSIYSNTTYKNFEIIIVDNNSTDDTNLFLQEAENKYSNLRVISNDENLGFGKANNMGAENAEGKYLLFLNNDTEVQRNWLTEMVSVFEKKKDAGIVGSKLLYPDGTIQHEGVVIIKDENLNYGISPWHVNYRGEDKNNTDQVSSFQAVTGACMMIRKELFDNVKGFDEEYWNGYEDIDLCFKILESGFQIYYQPHSILTHYESKSGEQRFVRENQNHERLQEIWSSKIIPNFIRMENGKILPHDFTSVIILTYNSSGTILNCLQSVIDSLREFDEVVIIDNHSQDNTVNLIENFILGKKQFRLIKNKTNLGFSAGINVGIKDSVNPYIVPLNPDTVVSKNWLDTLIPHFSDHKVGAVGPLSTYVAGMQKIDLYLRESLSAGISINAVSKKMTEWYHGQSIETKLLIGFCMAIKRTVINQLGDMDEDLFLGNDDLEYSWRLRLNGFKLKVALDSFIYHEGQHSFNTEEKSHTSRLVQKSTDALYKKLQEYYGENNVPTPQELWNVDWFTPSNAKFNSSVKLEDTLVEHKIGGHVSEIEHQPKNNLASIIMLTFNQVKYTKECVESIIKNTKHNFELIIVDNASTDNTRDYLKNLPLQNSKVKIFLNENNEGFPKGINQGVRAASGDYIVIVNNDILLTDEWLERMIEVAESKTQIGIVGPISNSVSGIQIDKEAKYKSINEMKSYAREIRKKNKGQLIEFPRVAFLCTLIKKEVIEKIGGLDERFSPGNYEDDDFCLRAQIAGFKTVIAKDVFIHHYGSKSFTADGMGNYKKRLETNRQIFTDKWGADPEEIWIKGKRVKQRQYNYPIDKNAFAQNFNRALVFIEDGEIQFAIDSLEKALQTFEEKESEFEVSYSDVLNLAGNANLMLGDIENAQKYFEEELSFEPNSSRACQCLADTLFAAQLFESSKAMFEWAIKNDPSNSTAISGLHKVNEKLGMPPEHNSLLIDSESIESNDNSETTPEKQVEQLLIDALALLKQEKFNEVIESLSQFDQNVTSNHQDEFSTGILSSMENLRGLSYLGLSNLDKAKDSFEKALELDPSSSQAYTNLGEVLFMDGKDNEAKTMFERACECDINNHIAIDGLAKVNTELGLDPNHNSLSESFLEETLNKIEELISQSGFEEARKLLVDLNKFYPGNVDVLNNYSVLEILDNNFEVAANKINEVIDIDPQNEIAASNLEYLQERINEAVQSVKSDRI